MTHDTRGMTIIELLIAMAVFSIVLGAAMRFMLAESRGFERGSSNMSMLQNMRFAADIMRQEIRTAGSHVPGGQPEIVYAGDNAFAYNSDLTSNVANDVFTVYVDIDAPAGQVTALTRDMSIVIPTSAVSYPDPGGQLTSADGSMYEDAPGVNSWAETVIFYFEPDAETARADDYVLRRQINGQPSAVVSRNLLAFPGRPFFEYFHVPGAAGGGGSQLLPVPAGWTPLSHSVPVHGTNTDIDPLSRIDELRAVRVSYTVTNGQSGDQERQRTISFAVPLPNVGHAILQTCGDDPIFGQAVGAVLNMGGPDPAIDLVWNAATDETMGEQDVVRYVIWRRQPPALNWGDPFLSIPAGNPNYLYSDTDVESGQSYQYMVAAQDCTPALSPQSVTAQVPVP